MATDYDSPWKEALDEYFPAFLEFFFPDIYGEVDWSKDYVVLDKELEQIVHAAEMGARLADKLFQVYRRDGQTTWVLIHIEVQAQAECDFAERMYVYNYRIYDKYQQPVVSLAVLGDDRPHWRPSEFVYELWGCVVSLKFRTVKLLDYLDAFDQLEQETNVFAWLVLAHLQAQATRHQAQARYAGKLRLFKDLLSRGLEAAQIRKLLRLIDWLMILPAELEQQFLYEIHEYKQEGIMPYIPTYERAAHEQGQRNMLCETIAVGLERRFGAPGVELLPVVNALSDITLLKSIRDSLWTATSLEEIRRLLPDQNSAAQ